MDFDRKLLLQKRFADKTEKMCPMCGKIYSVVATFDEFHEHVESHFVDDSATLINHDYSIEQNFEIISRIGDF